MKELLAAADKRLADGARGWEAALDVARRPTPSSPRRQPRPRRAAPPRQEGRARLAVLRVLAKTEKATDDDRLDLASLELRARARSTRRGHAGARRGAPPARAPRARGLDVGKALKKDRALNPTTSTTSASHFAEDDHPLGPELLELVVERAGRTKVGKMAKNKLGLVSG